MCWILNHGIVIHTLISLNTVLEATACPMLYRSNLVNTKAVKNMKTLIVMALVHVFIYDCFVTLSTYEIFLFR